MEDVELNAFIRDWGQTDNTLKNSLAEIIACELELVITSEFIISLGYYTWSEDYNLWFNTSALVQYNMYNIIIRK